MRLGFGVGRDSQHLVGDNREHHAHDLDDQAGDDLAADDGHAGQHGSHYRAHHAADDEPAQHHSAALSTVTLADPSGNRAGMRLLVLSLVALTALVSLKWLVQAQGPQRDRDVVHELSAPRDSSRLLVVVGTDSRQRVQAEAGDRFGAPNAVTTEWADVVMLVMLHPPTHTARVLSLPRELLVDVEGQQKLGATLESGGPRSVVRAVKRLTGLEPNHYVQLDFLAFDGLVDAAGGVVVDVAAPARDVFTGLELAGGRQRLDGAAALAYARSRSYEEWRDGAWTPLDDGDLGRIERQHRLLLAIAAEGTVKPSLTGLWAARDAARHMKVDARLSSRELLTLARHFSSIAPSHIDVQTLPTVPLLADGDMVSPFPPFHVGAVAYLVPAEPAATAAISAFAGVKR